VRLYENDEAGQLDATNLTPDSFTRLSWCWGHLDAGYVLVLGTSWGLFAMHQKNYMVLWV